MEANMYTTLEDFIIKKEETINDLIFRGDDKKNAKLPKAGAGLLKTFKQFVAYQILQGIPFGPNDWLAITQDEFNKFQISNANNITPLADPSAPPASTTKPATNDLVCNFKQGIKCNIMHFTVLKDDSM